MSRPEFEQRRRSPYLLAGIVLVVLMGFLALLALGTLSATLVIARLRNSAPTPSQEVTTASTKFAVLVVTPEPTASLPAGITPTIETTRIATPKATRVSSSSPTIQTSATYAITATPKPTSTTAPAAQSSAYIGSSVTAAGSKLTVTAAAQRTTVIAQGTAVELKAQGEFVIIPVKLEDVDGNYDCVNLKLFTSDGKGVQPSESGTATYNTVNDLDSPLPSCIDAGEVRKGALVFEIPSGASLSRLRMENVAGEGNAIDLSK